MSFLNPLFLLGLLGMGIPLVIHLLSRRTARKVEFSTLDFLMNLERKSMRRIRIRQLLLLLVRMALVACVALAMARPTLTNVSAGTRHGVTSAAIILDCSYSMNATRDGATLFEEAQERAREVLTSLHEGDEVALFFPGSEEAPPDRGIRDLALAGEGIERARPGEGQVDLVSAVRGAAEFLAGARNPKREIHVISDYQASAWLDAENAVVPSGVDLYFFPVGGEEPVANAWIESVDYSGQILEKGSPIEFRTIVATSAGFENMEAELEMEIDGRVVDRRRVDLGPSSRVVITFRETFVEDGLHLGAIRIKKSAGLEEDDERTFTLRTEKAVPVLLISGAEHTTRYLRSALAPEGATTGTFAVRNEEPSALTTASRDRESVIVIADVDRLTEEHLAGLKRFLSDGGGLVVFPGPSTDAAAWGRSFLPKFLPGSLADVENSENGITIARLDPSHRLFDIFRDGDGGLLDVRFTRTLNFRANAGTAVLASYATGRPAIVESRLLPGRVLFFTSSLDPSWSDFPLTGAFLPLVHEAVRYLSEGASSFEREVEVGGSATIRLADLPEGGGVTLRDPQGETQILAPVADASGYALSLPRASSSGFWVFESSRGDTLAALAANISSKESDPERVTPRDVRDRLAVKRGQIFAAGGSLGRGLRDARLGREIRHWFLWAAALFLLAEMALASRAPAPQPSPA